jgi:hypothetical protein
MKMAIILHNMTIEDERGSNFENNYSDSTNTTGGHNT